MTKQSQLRRQARYIRPCKTLSQSLCAANWPAGRAVQRGVRGFSGHASPQCIVVSEYLAQIGYPTILI